MRYYDIIKRYVEERFSTYTSLMDFAIESNGSMSDDEKVIARFSNYIMFTKNIRLEVEEMFRVKGLQVDVRNRIPCDDEYVTDYITTILYNNSIINQYAFRIENNLLKKYQEGNRYEQLN